MEENKILFQGEMQLAAWGESMQTGAWVKMWVHPEDLEAFKLMKARTGKHAGQRLGVAIVQLGDDEAVVEHAPAEPKPEPSSGPRPAAVRIGDFGRCAVMWCKRPDFRRWASEASDLPIGDEDDAKEFILDECGVTAAYGTAASRKHLDVAPFSDAFLDKVFHPFTAYCRKHGIDLTRKPD